LQTITGQKCEATLYFKDGTVLKGYGKLKINGVVKFRKTLDEKPKKHDFVVLEKMETTINEDSKVFVQVKVKNKEKLEILDLEIKGKLNLYIKINQGYNHNFSGNFEQGGMSIPTGVNFYSIQNYYVKRKDENQAFHLGSNQAFSKNFKKAASLYFSDCPELVNKIENKVYKKKDLKRIIKFYNENCI